jgi:hypothetical protein
MGVMGQRGRWSVATKNWPPSRPRWAVATQAASAIPFGALAQLLPNPSGIAPDQAQLLQQAAEALRAEADKRQLVLGVDDAHLLYGVSPTRLRRSRAAASAR